MIEYIRSFIDQISFEALQVTIFIWVVGYLLYYLISKFFNVSFFKIIKSKYNNDFILIILFIISFIVIRYYIKIKFVDKYLNF
mgnify:FL=1